MHFFQGDSGHRDFVLSAYLSDRLKGVGHYTGTRKRHHLVTKTVVHRGTTERPVQLRQLANQVSVQRFLRGNGRQKPGGVSPGHIDECLKLLLARGQDLKHLCPLMRDSVQQCFLGNPFSISCEDLL